MDCRYVADVLTDKVINDIIITEPQGDEDVVFSFTSKDVQGSNCENDTVTNYLYLQDNLDIIALPSQLAISGINYAMGDDNKTFNVTIPASEQSKFPLEQTVNLVFTVYWSKDPDNRESLSYLNLVYRVKFALKI